MIVSSTLLFARLPSEVSLLAIGAVSPWDSTMIRFEERPFLTIRFFIALARFKPRAIFLCEPAVLSVCPTK